MPLLIIKWVLLALGAELGVGGWFWRRSAVRVYDAEPSKPHKKKKTLATLLMVVGAWLFAEQLLRVIFGTEQKGKFTVEIWAPRVTLAGQSVSTTVLITWAIMAVFAQFGADVDASTKKLLARGERMTELLKQRGDEILKLSQQVALLCAYSMNALENVPVRQAVEFKKRLLQNLAAESPAVLAVIDDTKKLTEDVRRQLEDAIRAFAANWTEAQNAERQ